MSTARDLATLDERLTEVSDLLGRFRLLEAQYRSDLDRLAMVNEVGSVLGYFKIGTCVFCGADPEHQRPGHGEEETTQLHAAVEAEAAKTTTLLGDLLPTIEDLGGEQAELVRHRNRAQSEIGTWDEMIAELEQTIAPCVRTLRTCWKSAPESSEIWSCTTASRNWTSENPAWSARGLFLSRGPTSTSRTGS